MKKFQPLAWLALVMIAIACLSNCTSKPVEQEEPETQVKEAAPITQFRLALAGLNTEDQKSIFKSLAASAKSALWKDRLAMAMEDAASAEQKDILKKIQDRIHPGLYSDTNTTQVNDFASYLNEVYESAAASFGKDTTRFYNMLLTLGEPNNTPSIAEVPAIPGCNCNISNNGNLRANDCGALSKNCAAVTCIRSPFSCGVLWLQTCDGRCS